VTTSEPARYDVGVVGGGAAGLMTAITAARERPSLRCAVFEGQRKPGIKILASGGGRCNVTNLVVSPSDFHGDRGLVARVLRRFTEKDAVRFFEELGVPLKHEPEFDKMFPESDSAQSVLDALLAECARLGVRVECGFRVDAVAATTDGFEVRAGERVADCGAVVLATGGRSLPKSGSDGAGYLYARSLGHTVGETAPALVPIVLQPHVFEGLDGIAVPAELSVWSGGKRVAQETGPALVTHFGLSGPSPMNVSRHFAVGKLVGAPPEIRMNVFPGRTSADVETSWLDTTRDAGARNVGSLLATLPGRLARRLFELAEVDPDGRLSEMSKNARKRLLESATNLRLPVTDTRGWNAAEVTAGGVPLSEVDVRTMESKKRPGLFLVGEILDVDGRIGGFNFQWAWATGFIAGQALAVRAAAAR
jgi:predicted Rossmann fold flavoprotein